MSVWENKSITDPDENTTLPSPRRNVIFGVLGILTFIDRETSFTNDNELDLRSKTKQTFYYVYGLGVESR